LLFEANGPVSSVDDETSVISIEEVLGCALGGVKDAGFFAALAGVVASPGRGRGLFGFVGLGTFLHPIERLGFGEDGEGVVGDAGVGSGDGVGIVANSGENDVLLVFGDDLYAGGLLVIASVMADPGVAEDLVAKAFFEFLSFVLEVVAGEFFPGRDFESVRRGAESDDGSAALQVFVDMDHLVVGEIEEAREDEHEFSVLESFEALDVGGAGCDFALLVDSEENGRFEAVMFGKDAGEGGAGFLGPVFVIGGNKDDVLSLAGTGSALVGDLRESGK